MPLIANRKCLRNHAIFQGQKAPNPFSTEAA